MTTTTPDDESHDAASIAPDPFALGGRQDDDDDDAPAVADDVLRRVCEAYAAECRAALPEGDAGLAAAVQRWRELVPGRLGVEYTADQEERIVEPVATWALIDFEDRIQGWYAEGLPGVVTKLRYALTECNTCELDDAEVEHMIAIIERRDLPAGDRAAEPVARGLPAIDPIIGLIAAEEKMSERAAAAYDRAFGARQAATRAGRRAPDQDDDPLFAETRRLKAIADEMFDRVRAAKATTIAGAIAQFKALFVDSEDDVKSVVASLRNVERLLAGGAK